MVNNLSSTSAIEEWFDGNWYGADQSKGARFSIMERQSLSLILVHLEKGDSSTRLKIESCIGASLFNASGPVGEGKNIRVIWTQPNQWMLVAEEISEWDLEQKIRSVAPSAAIVNITNSRTIFRLSGYSVRDMLSKGCSIDLHPKIFCSGMGLTTLLGHFTVTLNAISDETIDLYITRSFGLACLEWLRLAGEEFGYLLEQK